MDIIQAQCVELNWKTAQLIGVLSYWLAMRIRYLLDSNTFKVLFGPLSELSKKDYISAFMLFLSKVQEWVSNVIRLGIYCLKCCFEILLFCSFYVRILKTLLQVLCVVLQLRTVNSLL